VCFSLVHNITNKRFAKKAEIAILCLIMVFIIALFLAQRPFFKMYQYLTRIAHTVLVSDEKHVNT